MKTVHEVSSISGVSVRTLHHYDAIGLLKPTEVTGAGYRLYDDEALTKLKTVLMYRELGFKLTDIKEMIESPDFDLNTALSQHIVMLKLQRDHIDVLIKEAERMMEGESTGFTVFDKEDMKKYAQEVKERWGDTDAYRESLEKEANRTEKDESTLEDRMLKILAAFGALKDQPADSPATQSQVKQLQDFITENCYRCTKEILNGLGEMYTADERFRKNIDSAGGEDTAAFISEAVKIYCRD